MASQEPETKNTISESAKRSLSSGTTPPEPKRQDTKKTITDFFSSDTNTVERPSDNNTKMGEEMPAYAVQMQKDMKTIIDKLSAIESLQSQLVKAEENIRTIKGEVKDHETAIIFAQKDIEDLKQENANLKERLEKLEKQAESTEERAQIDRLEKQLTDLESYGRRDNLIFEGVGEQPKENCENLVKNVIKNKLKLDKNMKFTRVHRLGKKSDDSNFCRPIIARFHYWPDREMVWQNRKVLMQDSVSIREDFPLVVGEKRKVLLPYHKAAIEQKMKTTLRGDRLIIDSVAYSVKDLAKLEAVTRPREVCERTVVEQKLHLFYGCLSPLSNMYSCDFDVGGQRYNSVEQFYTSEKARICNDTKAHTKIMKVDAKRAKGIAKKIKVSQKWTREQAEETMRIGVKAKFSQNDALKKELLSLKGLQLVECNPYDRTWSCGHRLTSKEAETPSVWEGRNILGHILTELRQELSR